MAWIKGWIHTYQLSKKIIPKSIQKLYNWQQKNCRFNFKKIENLTESIFRCRRQFEGTDPAKSFPGVSRQPDSGQLPRETERGATRVWEKESDDSEWETNVEQQRTTERWTDRGLVSGEIPADRRRHEKEREALGGQAIDFRGLEKEREGKRCRQCSPKWDLISAVHPIQRLRL